MNGAARLGDILSDGDVIVMGSGNVFINGMPAVRVGDATSGHGCFPPTTIATGSTTVFVNGLPMVRKTDTSVPHACVIVVDFGTVSNSSSDVFVG